MSIDWFSVFLGWLGGIPSGILANFLFHKLLRWKKRKGEYLTTTVSTDGIEFEGRVWHNTTMVATMNEITKQVLGVSAPPPVVKSKKGK